MFWQRQSCQAAAGSLAEVHTVAITEWIDAHYREKIILSLQFIKNTDRISTWLSFHPPTLIKDLMPIFSFPAETVSSTEKLTPVWWGKRCLQARRLLACIHRGIKHWMTKLVVELARSTQTSASSYRSLSVLLQHTDFANPMQSFWSFPMEQEVRDATWCSFSGAISDFKCVVISTDTCMSFFFDYLVLFFFLFYRKRFGQKTGTKGDQGSKTLGSWNEGATISELPNPANACASLLCWIM